nr:MAG TPA: hypothetical protein [Caudoviricetes sp.]
MSKTGISLTQSRQPDGARFYIPRHHKLQTAP